MTWEIVAGLITLSGFLISFCTVIAKNTAAMTELRTTLRDFRESYDRAHSDLEHRVEKHGQEIDEHGNRITRLEEWRRTRGE